VPLTSVRQPRDKLGRRAAELLISETIDAAHEHQAISFVPELVVRSSTRGERPRGARRS
jgi:LacI family transcriptional regulator